MHLLVVHYHWRPGGVRRVVEDWINELAATQPAGVRSLVFAAGEPPPAEWARTLQQTAGAAIPLRFTTHPLLGYAASWPGGPADHRHELASIARRLVHGLGDQGAIILENPAVGRHPFLAQAFATAAAELGTRLLCHHHDFFVDGRWARWPEWRACGLHTMEQAWDSMVPLDPTVSHAVVTRRDARWLAPDRPVHFIPNHPPPPAPPAQNEIDSARTWLHHQLGSANPVWLCPTRALRRKNLAEAALLARLIHPNAQLATTGAVSSMDENRYAEAVARPIPLGGAGVAIGLLGLSEAAGAPAPTVGALMAAADRVVISSLYEGFGLPVIEASDLRVPTLARRDACPDGQVPPFIDTYSDVLIPSALTGARDDLPRQQRAWIAFTQTLPPGISVAFPSPAHWENIEWIPFSRLTLAGQLRVLGTVADSPGAASAIRRANPWIAAPTDHPTPPPPPTPENSPPATTLTEWITDPITTPLPKPATDRVPIIQRLSWANHYPLLWPGGDHPLP